MKLPRTNDQDLTFSDFLSKLDEFGKGEWISAYEKIGQGLHAPVFYSALIRLDLVPTSLSDPSWDLSIGNGRPGFSFHFEGEKEVSSYVRPSDEGIEPLVLWRSFHGIRQGYWEVAEEFRLYFDLFEDRQNSKLILIDDNGDEEDAVILSSDYVKVKLRLIKEFLAAKQMCLSLFFDFNRFSEKTLEELRIEEFHETRKGDDYVFSIGARPWTFGGEDHRSHAFLMGKKLIPGAIDFNPSILGRQDRKFADFVIGVGENGNEISHTCDEDRLANYFGKNPGSPQYVTPVFFRKAVLAKYYADPAKFSVEDGRVQCAGLWSLRLDNNHPDSVMVFLGDLGHLSYSEQLFWRSFNVASGKMSHTAFARSVEGKFEDPEDPALFFRQKFGSFQEAWRAKFGWKLFREMDEEDEYCFRTLRVPLTNGQKEFDEQVLAITKVFVDSLNEAELEKRAVATKENPKGLDKFESFLRTNGVRRPQMVEFLRKLQALRSVSVAHLKGKNYEKIKKFFGIEDGNLSMVFGEILVKCVWTLNSLTAEFLDSDTRRTDN